ncbi:hypothetical protein [Pseudomonas sp. RL_5y_Pfl2_73]|uniref:hypothetical protein n=1 Tax=Pseudomonas sp. RL_5y_Pfl2_73 TaxID=3088713 RepID=UPI0030DB973B
MSTITLQQQGDISISVSNDGLVEGWEIRLVTVNGEDALRRKGDYESKEAAEKAAFEIAAQFKEGRS